MEKNILNKIGVCPVCGKGQIIENPVGYTCNYFKKIDETHNEKCDFIIYRRMHGVNVTEAMAKTLIETGTTDEMDMINRDGRNFRAKFILKDGKISLGFEAHYLNGKCPVCGGKIKKVGNGYACENFFKEVDRCNFYIGGITCNRQITEEEAENFIAGTEQILDGFSSKAGKIFSSRLTIDKDGKVLLDSQICKCPKCGGDIHVGMKAYNCSNYRNEQVQCNFSVWRNIAGHVVSLEEIRELCRTGETKPIQFYKKDGGPFTKALKIDEDSNIIMI